MATDPSTRPEVDTRACPLQALLAEIRAIDASRPALATAEDLEAVERRLGELTDRLHGLLLERQVQRALDGEALRQAEAELCAHWPVKLRGEGLRAVRVLSTRGVELTLRARYQRPRGGCRRRRRRGLYPGLVLLGIQGRCTPGLAAEVGVAVAALGSLAEARALLARRGVELDVKTLRAVAYALARRARAVQHGPRAVFTERVDGRRVVVSTDGGRVRMRLPKRGPRTAKGRRRYRSDWREPKVLIVYVVDAQGCPERTFAPVLDATLRGPAAVFALLRYYLGKLALDSADRVAFVADGAAWIWKRVADLMADLGLPPSRYHEVLDFYHAVEHLAAITRQCRNWSGQERERWLRVQRRQLRAGAVAEVIAAVRTLCRGRRSKTLRTERDYLIGHRARMAYAEVADAGLPIGSGAMESAVRRVVNLRLKGPGIFWKPESAEAVLMLRSFYKAGRWNALMRLALAPTAALVA